MRHATIPLVSLAVLLFAAAPAPAQTCGPLTFVFGATGPGCAPFGGAAPTLSAALAPSPSIASCPLVFTMTPGGLPSPLPVVSPAFLILGIVNPMLDLTPLGLPGCTLLASPDAILPMTLGPAGPVYTVTIPVPAVPSMIGGSAFAQGGIFGPSPTLFSPRLSNGVSVDIV